MDIKKQIGLMMAIVTTSPTNLQAKQVGNGELSITTIEMEDVQTPLLERIQRAEKLYTILLVIQVAHLVGTSYLFYKLLNKEDESKPIEEKSEPADTGTSPAAGNTDGSATGNTDGPATPSTDTGNTDGPATPSTDTGTTGGPVTPSTDTGTTGGPVTPATDTGTTGGPVTTVGEVLEVDHTPVSAGKGKASATGNTDGSANPAPAAGNTDGSANPAPAAGTNDESENKPRS